MRDAITGVEIEIPDEWVAPAYAGPQGPQGPQMAPGIPPWVLQGFTAGQPVPFTAVMPQVVRAITGQPVPATAVMPQVVRVIAGQDDTPFVIPPFVAPIDPNQGLPGIPGLTAPVGPLPGIIQPLPAGAIPFTYRPKDGEDALALFEKAGGKDVTILTDDLRQGLMTALVHAEELAAKMGWSDLNPDGSPIVGSGRKKSVLPANVGTPEGNAYNAVQQAVENAISSSTAMPAGTVPSLSRQVTVAVAPALGIGLVVVIIVLGAAALAAQAFIATSVARTVGDALVRVRQTQIAADLAREGKPIPPGMIPPPPGPGQTPGGLTAGIGVGLAVAAAAAIGLLVLAKK